MSADDQAFLDVVSTIQQTDTLGARTKQGRTALKRP